MAATQTLLVGNNPAATYVAFGDDSQYGDSLAFAYALVARRHLQRATDRMEVLREKYRIPETVGVHCRVLFSGDARERAGLSHLDGKDTESLIARVITAINAIPVQIRYATCSLKQFQQFADAKGGMLRMADEQTGEPVTQSINVDPKGIIGLLANMCFATSADANNGPPASDCELFVARDDTRVKLFGEKKAKAHRTYGGFSDIGAPANSVFKIDPTPIDAKQSTMLEYADVAAYIISHAYGSSSRINFWQEQLTRIKHYNRSALEPHIENEGGNESAHA